jgi:hypothetical protein
MKTILLLAALLALLGSPALAQRTCDQSRASITTGSMGVTEKVAAITNKRIYLCGYMILPGTGGPYDFELSTGTGVNCAINRTIVIPRSTVPSGGIVNRTSYAAGAPTPPSQAMCLQTWGGTTGSISSVFYWAQF